MRKYIDNGDMYYTDESQDKFKVEQKVFVKEINWPYREFGYGIIDDFEINVLFKPYRIGINLNNRPITNKKLYFLPQEVFIQND